MIGADDRLLSVPGTMAAMATTDVRMVAVVDVDGVVADVAENELGFNVLIVGPADCSPT